MGRKRKSKYPYIFQENSPPIPSYYHNSKFLLEIRPSIINKAGLGVFSLCNIPNNFYLKINDELGIS